jgi:hypothetical protein
MALVRTDVSEELGATGIDELGTTLAVTRRRRTPTNSCHPDDGGATLLRNVGCYKSHTA